MVRTFTFTPTAYCSGVVTRQYARVTPEKPAVSSHHRNTFTFTVASGDRLYHTHCRRNRFQATTPTGSRPKPRNGGTHAQPRANTPTGSRSTATSDAVAAPNSAPPANHPSNPNTTCSAIRRLASSSSATRSRSKSAARIPRAHNQVAATSAGHARPIQSLGASGPCHVAVPRRTGPGRSGREPTQHATRHMSQHTHPTKTNRHTTTPATEDGGSA